MLPQSGLEEFHILLIFFRAGEPECGPAAFMSGIPIYLFDKILNAKVEIYLKEIVKQGYVSRILEGFQINTKAIYFLSMVLKNSIFSWNSFVQGSRNVGTGPAGPTNFY